MLKLSDYRKELNPREVRHWRDLEIAGVSNNSREIGKGFIFCAIRGAKNDGRRYIANALENGAAAIVSDDPLLSIPDTIPHLITDNAYHAWGMLCQTYAGFPGNTMHLHAVTGTNGKTTTAFLLRNLIQRTLHAKCGLISTVEYDCGAGSPAVESVRTTPDAMAFQKIMKTMAENGCTHVVLEASSHGLHQKRMGSAKFDTAVFTNLTGDHLDYHHTMEAYYQAKKTLFSDQLSEKGHAIVNIDDPWGARLAEELRREGKNTVTLSARSAADCRITSLSIADSGSVFQLEWMGKTFKLRTNLIGLHNLYNLGSAAAAALAMGIPAEELVEHLSEEVSVPGRLEMIALPNGASAFVDYAHTDDALERVLSALRPLCRGRLICVFGCGGDRDRTKRPRMAEVCGRLSDLPIITSDNPRTEKPEDIIEEAASGMPSGKEFLKITDRKSAIEKAVALSRPGDLILIAGKGHENYQEINGVRHHFDDREILKNLSRTAG